MRCIQHQLKAGQLKEVQKARPSKRTVARSTIPAHTFPPGKAGKGPRRCISLQRRHRVQAATEPTKTAAACKGGSASSAHCQQQDYGGSAFKSHHRTVKKYNRMQLTRNSPRQGCLP